MHLLDFVWRHIVYKLKLGDGTHLSQHQSKTEMRFCNHLEDEFHFALECQLYQDLRNEYIKTYFRNRPNIPKLIEILPSKNKKNIKNLSVFMYKS